MNPLDLLFSLSFVFLVMFLTYTTLIIVPFVRRRRAPEGDPRAFEWHAFIPCRDEATVIAETLKRTRELSPDMHVWIIDDASVDGTGDIVSAVAATDPLVHAVIRRLPDARTGKGAALNAAYRGLREWRAAREDGVGDDRTIVIVLDADGSISPNALRQAVGPEAFGSPTVGAVQVAVRMSNRDDPAPLARRGRLAQRWARYLIRMQDIEFRTTIAAMQVLRMRTVSVGLGGNGQFTRLSALQDAAIGQGTPWGDALLEDYEVGLRIMLAGYRTVYAHDAFVSQEALPSARRLLTQRTRWCQGGLQCARYLPRIYSSRAFTNAGALEAAYFLAIPYIQLIGFVLWPAVGIAMLVSGALAPGGLLGWMVASAWIVPLWVLTGILPFASWPLVYVLREERQPLWRAAGWGLGYWLYMYQSYVCVLRAFGRTLVGRRGWTKTRRNAEAGRLLLAAES
ncbi:cellulose synthase/poly-beta-1,6-N-acetylglucosamine synthase-like glycosyltransferase [Microbacterium sp. 1154]|uniref:glycosyltransferase family 2 protein n=1 Tax=Microbacterium sp. 1154 TaxID=2817733 RepID=UPI002860E7DC|nr:glycosyltransferase family 2 protein [Microbacterium sp. 1154]MDR6689907.1 cellulose synthase/poly-beta-1,6-N-acetylglucosamine synthase-like glycosyltransferase [Microbacterium sp. 1154]